MEHDDTPANAEIFSAVAAKALPAEEGSFNTDFFTMCGQPRTKDDWFGQE